MKYLLTIQLLIFAIIGSTQVDTNKIKQLLIKADAYLDTNKDSSLIVLNQVKKIVPLQSRWYAETYHIEGNRFNMLGDYKNAVLKFDSAISIFSAGGLRVNVAKDYNNQGVSYMYLGNYSKAIQLQFEAAKIHTQVGNIKAEAQALNNIALNYQSLKDWENAIRFSKEALKLKRLINDSSGILYTVGNIANYFYDTKQYDSATLYIKAAIYLASKLQDQYLASNSYLSMGSIFYDKNQYDSALYYHNLSCQNITPDRNDIDKIGIYVALMNDYIAVKNDTLFKKYFKYSDDILKNIDDPEVLYNYYHTLYNYYKHQNIADAFAALEKSNYYKAILDSTSNNLDNQKIAIKYELNKKVVADSLQMQQQVNIAKTRAMQSENKFLIAAIVLLVATSIAGVLYNRSKALKKKNIIAEQQKQLAEQEANTYQLKTLQAQMNPHFVFNCFSTIDSLIIQGKQMEASILVQRFSKLSRRILEHTSQQYISFEEEIKTLETYLQIEQTRSSDKFDFKIEKNPNLMQYQVPPMLLQPFVENAVVHGVRGLQDRQGLITIKFRESADKIKIIIEDNGIGRNKAAEIKSEGISAHRSMSMQLTLERLKSLHKNNFVDYLQVIDKQNAGSGTIVSIIIPKIGINA